MDEVWARIERLAADREAGAAQIARRAAVALAAIPADRVDEAVNILVRGHPSMAPLWRLATEVLGSPSPESATRAFLARLDEDEGAATTLASVLPDRILTISYSSTVVEAIRQRRPLQTVCMMSEPGGEGWRVALETRDVTSSMVIDDDQALETVPGDAVVAGADAITPHGVVNKVKSRALAEAARSKGVPRYVVAGDTKFVAVVLPIRPAFELTPMDAFTAIAAPDGLLTPAEARRRAEARELHPQLRSLLDELSLDSG